MRRSIEHRISAVAIACADCDTILTVRPTGFGATLFGDRANGDWFMVKDRVWQLGQRAGACRFLCTGCLEHRIGRKLVAADFKRSVKVNFVGRKPLKLRRRMRGLKPATRMRETYFKFA